MRRSERHIGPPIRTRDPRGTTLVPTDMSYASRMSTTVDDGTLGTLRDASTPIAIRLGAGRSLVQIQSPRLHECPLTERAFGLFARREMPGTRTVVPIVVPSEAAPDLRPEVAEGRRHHLAAQITSLLSRRLREPPPAPPSFPPPPPPPSFVERDGLVWAEAAAFRVGSRHPRYAAPSGYSP